MPFYFSIIIPVYNVAPYLRECLDSILSQTFTDWEAICVDDGSTDGSGDILDEYVEQDRRFKVIHKSNEGVSRARQVGLDIACGSYIAWMDADDRADKYFLECFYNRLLCGNVDFVWTDCYEDKGLMSRYSEQNAPEEPVEYVGKMLEGDIWASLWNKAISREFIVKHKVGFPDSGCEMMEDVCFVLGVMSKRPRMAYLREAHYHYVMHDGTLTRQSQNHEEKYIRWIGGEKYVQLSTEAEFGSAFKVVLMRRMQRLLLGIYLDRFVSDDLFYGTFPEVRSIDGIDAPFWHRAFFKLARKGYRNIALMVMCVIRAVKLKYSECK